MQSEFSTLREKTRLSFEELSERLEYGVSTLYGWENGKAKPRKAVMETLRGIVDEVNKNPKKGNAAFTSTPLAFIRACIMPAQPLSVAIIKSIEIVLNITFPYVGWQPQNPGKVSTKTVK